LQGNNSTLELGKLYVFTQTFQPYKENPYSSLTKAAADLHTPEGTTRGLRNSIARALNTKHLVNTNAGQMYFVQNPNSPDPFLENQKGIYPCTLHDMETGTTVAFEGLKPIVKHLAWFKPKVTYDRLYTSYKKGTLIHKRFKVTPIVS